MVGYQQELGDGQGRLKIRNPISAIQRGISLSYPKRCLEHLEPEEFALCTGEQAENRCGTKRLAQLRGSQKVVLDVTSWGGSGGRLGWVGLGVGRWAGFIPEATGNARWAWEERGPVEMCVSGGSLAAGGRGREERQLAGEMGRPSGELRAGPAEGGGCLGAGWKGSWSGRRGFERL